MSNTKVLLGTDYVVAQNELQNTEIILTPTLCSNLTTFKSILRTSRQLDDAIPLRLNRQSALAASSSLSPAGCDRFWNELRSSWTARAKLIGYCENEMRPKVDSRHAVKVSLLTLSFDSIQRRQIANELQVESIIRSRSLALFQSRCPYHSQDPPGPPLPVSLDDEVDREERQRHRGRDGRGGVRWNG